MAGANDAIERAAGQLHVPLRPLPREHAVRVSQRDMDRQAERGQGVEAPLLAGSVAGLGLGEGDAEREAAGTGLRLDAVVGRA